MLVSSNVSPDSLADRGRIVDDFRELGERAAARGLRVGFEALAWGAARPRSPRRVGNRARRSIIPRSDWRSMRSARSRPASRSTASTRSIPKSCSTCRSPMRRSWPWIRCRGAGISAACPGRASCRWSNTSARCSSIGYDGVLSLEIFNDRFRAGSTADVALDGMRSLDYLLRAGGAQRRRRSAHGRCKGVEFIEFCAERGRGAPARPDVAHAGIRADPPARPQGRHALAAGRHQPRRQLRAGRLCAFLRHRAWRFGVRHRLARRGSGRGAAAARSRLQVQSFSQPVGPGEYEIPALRGVGGSLSIS